MRIRILIFLALGLMISNTPARADWIPSTETMKKWVNKPMEKYQEYTQKKEQENADCKQAVEAAYKKRQELGEDIFILEADGVVSSNKKIMHYINNSRITAVVDEGIIIAGEESNVSQDVNTAIQIGSLAFAGQGRGVLEALGINDGFVSQKKIDSLLKMWGIYNGHFIKNSCTADNVCLYIPGTDYAINERLHGNIIYQRVGAYTYEGQPIKAYKSSGHNVSEIEYKTYLNNKDLECCVHDDEIKPCSKDDIRELYKKMSDDIED